MSENFRLTYRGSFPQFRIDRVGDVQAVDAEGGLVGAEGEEVLVKVREHGADAVEVLGCFHAERRHQLPGKTPQVYKTF